MHHLQLSKPGTCISHGPSARPGSLGVCNCLHAAGVAAAPAEICAEDWHLLFGAVCWRLGRATAAAPTQVRLVMLECIEALGQLQAALARQGSHVTVEETAESGLSSSAASGRQRR